VAVFSGHNCVFVPFSSWACDHLEEMVFPLETWGKHFFVAMTHPVQDGTDETNMVRILSGEDAVTVTFTPSSVSAPVTLDKGGFVELMQPPGTDFDVTSTGIAARTGFLPPMQPSSSASRSMASPPTPRTCIRGPRPGVHQSDRKIAASCTSSGPRSVDAAPQEPFEFPPLM
jgi:hypothetical protein